MKLTAEEIILAQPKELTWKLFDGAGLHLEVRPNGAKYWRLAYRFNGKQRRLGLGTFPSVSLGKARIETDKAKELLAVGIDPSQQRKDEKAAAREELLAESKRRAYTLKALSREWVMKKRSAWTPAYESRVEGRLNRHLIRYLGETPIDSISRRQIITRLEAIEKTGKIDTAHRVREYIQQMFDYAEDMELIASNPAHRLRGILSPRRAKHRAHIESPEKLADLLRAIEIYQGDPVTIAALKLSPMLLMRPGEIRTGLWSEIEWSTATWRKESTTMKKRRIHLVPLATQAVEILEELFALTGEGVRIFPGANDPKRPMSENTRVDPYRAMVTMCLCTTA